MSLTLLSPNPGADGVAEDVLTVLNNYGTTRIPDLEIMVLDEEKREEKTAGLRLGKVSNLFIVERIRMPNSDGVGKNVIVYRTLLRIPGMKTYNAACYTKSTERDSCGIVDLTTQGLLKIGEHVRKPTTPGVWESLLQVEKMKRFRFS